MKYLIILLLTSLSAFAEPSILSVDGMAYFFKKKSINLVLGGPITNINWVIGQSPDAAHATNSIDLTGAKLIVVGTGVQSGRATVRNDGGLTFTAGTPIGDGGGHKTNQLFWATNNAGYSGTLTVMVDGTDPTFQVATFGSSGNVVLVSQSTGGQVLNGGSVQPGSLDPSGSTNLFVSGCAWGMHTGGPAGGGFVTNDNWIGTYQTGGNDCDSIIEWTTNTVAQNPYWLLDPTGSDGSSTMAMFTAVGGGGGGGGCGATIAPGDTLNQDFSASSPSGWTSSGASTVTFAATNPTNIPCQLTNKVLHAQWSGATFPYAYWDRGSYSCATYYFRFYFYVGSSSMGVNNGNIIDIFDADETTFGEGNDFRCSLLQQNDSSTLGFFVQFAGGAASSTNNITAGNWYRGEIQYVNSGAVAVKLYDSNNSQLGTTWTGTSANNKCFRFISTGVVGHNNTFSADVYITGVGVSSTGFLGP